MNKLTTNRMCADKSKYQTSLENYSKTPCSWTWTGSGTCNKTTY